MIAAAGLRFTYAGAGIPAVDDIDFEVADGEIFDFLGPSGAGKSTTQKILIGPSTSPPPASTRSTRSVSAI